MNQVIKLLAILTGLVMLAGCATDGYVSTSVTYYDPYPVYIGPPIVVYSRYHYHYYHPRPYCPPPVIVRPPQHHVSPPPVRHDVRQTPPQRPQPQIRNERRNSTVER